MAICRFEGYALQGEWNCINIGFLTCNTQNPVHLCLATIPSQIELGLTPRAKGSGLQCLHFRGVRHPPHERLLSTNKGHFITKSGHAKHFCFYGLKQVCQSKFGEISVLNLATQYSGYKKLILSLICNQNCFKGLKVLI